jgi:Ca-activated chloride channel family protein
MGVDFKATLFALMLGALGALLIYLSRPQNTPRILFSALGQLPKAAKSWRLQLEKVPEYMLWSAGLLFLIALCDPYTEHSNLSSSDRVSSGKADQQLSKPPAVEGAAIYLLLDQSLSMEEPVTIQLPSGLTSKVSKMSLLKDMTRDFIIQRPDDLIGIVTFARTPQVLAPLTLDHAALLKLLAQLDVMRIKDQAGTGIGYAIFKTATIIAATRHFAEQRKREGKSTYAINANTIIVVTDGLQDTNPLDDGSQWRTLGLEEAARTAARYGIRIYIVNVEPSLSDPKYAPQLRAMEQATALTGGRFFMAQRAQDLAKIYSEIDTLEKSLIPQPPGLSDSKVGRERPPERRTYKEPLLMAGLLLVLAALCLESLWLKKVP